MHKAQSSPLTITTLILVGLVALSLLAAIVFRVADSPSLAPEFSCVDWQLAPPLTVSKACYNAQTKDIELTLQRNKERRLTSFTLTTSSLNYQCDNQCSTCILQSPQTTKTYYLASSSKPEEFTLFLNNCEIKTQTIEIC
ncbi:MAG TPA: hypothetical protein VJK51_02055 [Candidatus Nanoarchaeia archaeon]|nr:hypothetical protein [Candidatus Nanoarchaeia archaeon]